MKGRKALGPFCFLMICSQKMEFATEKEMLERF